MKLEQIIKNQLNKVVKEQAEQENYMFFSNLNQISRQAKLLSEIDPSVIDNLLSNGHDWADDHMTEAKSLMDQVFDFIMNETKGNNDSEEPVQADTSQFSVNENQLDEECWDGYKAVGGKIKNGKRVPNCVPKNENVEVKDMNEEEIDESKNSPTKPELWSRAKSMAKSKFKVYPSAYANGWASKWYKSHGGGWRKSKG